MASTVRYKYAFNGDARPGLSNVAGVAIDRPVVDIPTFEGSIKATSGQTNIQPVTLTIQDDDGVTERSFWESIFDSGGVNFDVQLDEYNQTGVRISGVLYTGCEVSSVTPVEYSADAPVGASFTIVINPKGRVRL